MSIGPPKDDRFTTFGYEFYFFSLNVAIRPNRRLYLLTYDESKDTIARREGSSRNRFVRVFLLPRGSGMIFPTMSIRQQRKSTSLFSYAQYNRQHPVGCRCSLCGLFVFFLLPVFFYQNILDRLHDLDHYRFHLLGAIRKKLVNRLFIFDR